MTCCCPPKIRQEEREDENIKPPSCPVCPGTGPGLSAGRLSGKGCQKNVCVLLAFTDEIQKGTGGRGRGRKCHKLS